MKITKIKGYKLEKAEHGDGSSDIYQSMKDGVLVCDKTRNASDAIRKYNDHLILNQVKNN